MDIEGAEYHAVRGMISLLSRSPRIVLVAEFWPFSLLRSGVEPRIFLELLLNLGFFIYEIDEKSSNIYKTEIDNLLDAYTPENQRYTNLIFKRVAHS